MALASNIEGAIVTGAAGAELGTVKRVLYQLEGTRAIGLMVRPSALYYVVERTETFLPLAAVHLEEDGTVATGLKKLPTGRKAADGLGHDPDSTVIWTHMDVRGPSGEAIGIVTDVDFDAETGDVRGVEIGAGAVANAAHGKFVAPGSKVEGYRDGAIRLSVDAPGLQASGGLAKTAAETAAAASVAAKAAGEAIEAGVVAASGATGRAIKKVADAKVAEKTVKRVKTTWKDSVKAFREGLDGK